MPTKEDTVKIEIEVPLDKIAVKSEGFETSSGPAQIAAYKDSPEPVAGHQNFDFLKEPAKKLDDATGQETSAATPKERIFVTSGFCVTLVGAGLMLVNFWMGLFVAIIGSSIIALSTLTPVGSK
jgi:hypothetical protein